MWRDNRDYAITVQGDIIEGLQGATVTQQLLPGLRLLEASWQAQGLNAYRIEVAGAVEESAKGSASIAAGVPIMLFVTFTLLMLQLHSFSRAMLVFLTGPLGIFGVAAALLLSGRPFGFVALLGVIALMGVIQRNSVILIDQIEQDRASGIPAWDAIVGSAVRRFRPIILTAATAVLAEKAKTGKLTKEDISGGSFTVSNLGMFGVSNFTAIINPGQGGILAVSAVKEQPVVKNGQIVIGSVMKATVSVDHRIIDGVMASTFLKHFKDALEMPALLMA